MKSEACETAAELRIWCWGPLNLSVWAAVVYVMFLLAFMFTGRPGHGEGFAFPLYGPEEYIQGTYPLFWLVYIWLPLFMREFYVHRKHREPVPRQFWLQLLALAAISLPVYHFVFGWY